MVAHPELVGQRLDVVLGRADELGTTVEVQVAAEGVTFTTRPPGRSRASTTTTLRPAWVSWRAAARPERPAPTMTQSWTVPGAANAAASAALGDEGGDGSGGTEGDSPAQDIAAGKGHDVGN